MIILSQNKEELVNLDNAARVFLEELKPFGEYEIIVSLGGRREAVSIGRYKDRNSAKNVLRQLASCVNKDIFKMPDYDGERSMDDV